MFAKTRLVYGRVRVRDSFSLGTRQRQKSKAMADAERRREGATGEGASDRGAKPTHEPASNPGLVTC